MYHHTIRKVIVLLLWPILLYAFNAAITINTANDRKPISPWIYGTNTTLTETENWSMYRSGGNRWTGYNWENNASNAGSDWLHHSDNYLGGGDTPGKAVTDRHDANLAAGRISLFTVPMAGYVAKDKNGAVTESETAPSPRWDAIAYVKPTAFLLTPDLTDNVVYMDEYVNFLVDKYGKASSSTGIKGYLLDNEPALWPSTHARLHPAQPTCVEITDRSVALAAAIKAVDETAEIYGPVFYGFNAMYDFQGAPDWDSVSSGQEYTWFVDYYLHTMKQRSDSAGKRLLDVLDLHWYSEAKGDNRITDKSAATENDRKARVQAPRTLWQPGYVENSWIGEWFQAFLPLLPKVQESIDKYYPDTKISITEWNFGGEDDISGGIAKADILGIYGKLGVYAASYWKLWDSTDYTSAGFKIYRNFDGQKGAFGAIHVQATTDNWENGSVYAAQKSDTNTDLHLIIINKNFTEQMEAAITITSNAIYKDGVVRGFDSRSASIKQYQPISSIQNNTFTYTVPALSVYHIILKEQGNSIGSSLASLTGKHNNFKATRNKNGAMQYSLSLPESRKVTINLYDLQGKLIQTVFNGILGPGSHSRICAGRFATGIYCTTVKIDDKTFNGMIFVK